MLLFCSFSGAVTIDELITEEVTSGPGFNGEVIPGANSSTLTVGEPLPSHDGCYYCEASNRQGRVVSGEGCVRVLTLSVPIPRVTFTFTLDPTLRKISAHLEALVMDHLHTMYDLPGGEILMKQKLLDSGLVFVVTLLGPNMTDQATNGKPWQELNAVFQLAVNQTESAAAKLVEHFRGFIINLCLTSVKVNQVSETKTIKPLCPKYDQLHSNGYICGKQCGMNLSNR